MAHLTVRYSRLENRMKLYVSGPMTWVGPPTWNHPAFHKMACELRIAGHQVISPAELDNMNEPGWDEKPWASYLRRDLIAMLEGDGIDGIVMLPDWQNSTGAKLELHVAKALGMQVFYAQDQADLDRLGVK